MDAFYKMPFRWSLNFNIKSIFIPNKVTLFSHLMHSITNPERFNVVVSFLTYTYGLKRINIWLKTYKDLPSSLNQEIRLNFQILELIIKKFNSFFIVRKTAKYFG